MICGLIDGTLAITTIPPCLHRAAGVHLPLHPLGDILLEDLWVKCWELSTENWRFQQENSIKNLDFTRRNGKGGQVIGNKPTKTCQMSWILHLPFQNSWARSSWPILPEKQWCLLVSKPWGFNANKVKQDPFWIGTQTAKCRAKPGPRSRYGLRVRWSKNPAMFFHLEIYMFLWVVGSPTTWPAKYPRCWGELG